MNKYITKEHPSFHIFREDSGHGYRVCDPMTNLNDLIGTVDQIITGKEIPYELLHGNLRSIRNPTKLGLFLKNFSAYVRQYDGDLSYSPDLQLFFDCVKNYPERFWDHVCESDFFAEHVSRFVEIMREEGKKANVKKKVGDWKRGVNKNKQRITCYLDRLFECYSRLLVVRVDLHYRRLPGGDAWSPESIRSLIDNRGILQRNAFYSGDELPSNVLDMAYPSLQELKKYYKKWYDNSRNKPLVFRDMVGHVVRFEFSKGGGYHIHAVLFFDGSKRQKDQNLGTQIGEYWKGVTNGRGYYFNCNRENYPDSGIGMVNYYDEAKRKNLYSALDYLAKHDQHVRVKSSSKQKLFSTGKMPDAPDQNLGRPRRKNQTEE